MSFSVLAGAIVFNVIKEKLCPAAGTPGFRVFWPELCRTRRCCRHCSRDLIDGGAGTLSEAVATVAGPRMVDDP